MSDFLEAVLAFVGVMFILALAAQSVQEIIKAMFTIKGQTLLKAVGGLVKESVLAQGQSEGDAEAIMKELTRRLQALGQQGVRKKALRLDTLPAPKLRELIEGIHPTLVPGLAVGELTAKDVLARIAGQAEKWYDLAIAPVDDRYRRRMRGYALLASAIVVIPLNAGAGRVYEAARSDTTFQRKVTEAVARLDSIGRMPLDTVRVAVVSPTDTAAAVVDSADLLAAARDSTGRARDSVTVVIAAQDRAALAELFGESRGLLEFGFPTSGDFQNLNWWLGIVVSVLFVSLGAPFWHDLLETVFGLKNRLRGPTVPEAKQAEREMLSEPKRTSASGAGGTAPTGIPAAVERAAERLIDERAARLPATP